MNSSIILSSEQPQSSAIEHGSYSTKKSTNQTEVQDQESDQFQNSSDSLTPARNKPRSRRSIMASKLINPVYVHYDSHPTTVNNNMLATGTSASTNSKAANYQINGAPSSSSGSDGTPVGRSNGKSAPNTWSRSHMRSVRRISNEAVEPAHEVGKKSQTTKPEDKLNLSGHSSYLTFKEPVEEVVEVEAKEEERKPSFDSDFKIPNDTRVNERGKIIHAYFGETKTNVNVDLSSSLPSSIKNTKKVLSNKSKSKSSAPSSFPNKFNSNNMNNGTNNLDAKVIAQKKSVSARRLRDIRSREREHYHSARKLAPTPLVANETHTNNDHSQREPFQDTLEETSNDNIAFKERNESQQEQSPASLPKSSLKKTGKKKKKLQFMEIPIYHFEYDRFGFVIDNTANDQTTQLPTLPPTTSEAVITPQEKITPIVTPLELEAKREAKWLKMLEQWDKIITSSPTSALQARLKRRVRKGIPHSIRGQVWATMANVPKKINGKKKGEYKHLLKVASKTNGKGGVLNSVFHLDPRQEYPNPQPQIYQEQEKDGLGLLGVCGSNESEQVFKDTIERDINRTFPTHKMFLDEEQELEEEEQEEKEEGSKNQSKNESKSKASYFLNAKGGQASLRRVLRAYSIIDPEVGYCQGMNFISAMFIVVLKDNEEEAFWLLESIMEETPCRMRGLFGNGMAEAQEVLYIAEKVIFQCLPKLAAHFDREHIHVTMFATQWLLTMYSSCFSFDLVMRVWDCFLFEGWKIAYRVMLAILSIYETDLLNMRFEEILEFLKQMPTIVDGQLVMQTAFVIPLRAKHITKYKIEYKTKGGGVSSYGSRRTRNQH